MTFSDTLIKIMHGFRGYPRQIGARQFRVDESLRRWNFADEDEVRGALLDNLDAGDTAIDIGANFGMHTLVMGDRVGSDGHVIAFEPIPENLRLLKRNIFLNHFDDRVDVVPCALSDDAQRTLQMVVSSDSLEPSAAITMDSSASMTTIEVENRSLDDATTGIATGTNCFVKIDVEGAELSVLRSGKAFLRSKRPRLLIEVHEYALPQFGDSADRLYQFLQAQDYEIDRISDMRNHNGQYHHLMAFPR